MNLTRRRLLTGLIAAPMVIVTPGLLMPVKALELDLSGYQIAKYEPSYVDPGWYDAKLGCWFRPAGTCSYPARLLAVSLNPDEPGAIKAVMKHGRWVKSKADPFEPNAALPTRDENYDRYEAAYKTIQDDLSKAPGPLFHMQATEGDHRPFHAVIAAGAIPKRCSSFVDGQYVEAERWD